MSGPRRRRNTAARGVEELRLSDPPNPDPSFECQETDLTNPSGCRATQHWTHECGLVSKLRTVPNDMVINSDIRRVFG